MLTGTMHRLSPDGSQPLVRTVWCADRPLERMRGLLGRPALKRDEGLLIEPCSSIHTVGMRYVLDIVFLDAAHRVVRLCRHVVPLRMAFGWGARSTLEMADGEIDRLGLNVGDQLQWRPA